MWDLCTKKFWWHDILTLMSSVTTKLVDCGRRGESDKIQHIFTITTCSKQYEDKILVKVTCAKQDSIQDWFSSVCFLCCICSSCVFGNRRSSVHLTRAQGYKFLVYSITDVQVDDPVHEVKTNKENWKHNPWVLINIAGTNAE